MPEPPARIRLSATSIDEMPEKIETTNGLMRENENKTHPGVKRWLWPQPLLQHARSGPVACLHVFRASDPVTGGERNAVLRLRHSAYQMVAMDQV